MCETQPSAPVRGRHARELSSELRTCAWFADGTRGDALVPLADFTRHRIAKALRDAATELDRSPVAPRAPRHEQAPAAGSDRIHADRLEAPGNQDELLAAAECYLQVARFGPDAWHNPDGSYAPPGGWPWTAEEWSPGERRVENLLISVGLISAAYEAVAAERSPAPH